MSDSNKKRKDWSINLTAFVELPVGKVQTATLECELGVIIAASDAIEASEGARAFLSSSLTTDANIEVIALDVVHVSER